MTHHVLFGFKVFLAIFVAIALTLAFFYVGFFSGYSLGMNNGMAQGWLAAKKVVDEKDVFPNIPLENRVANILNATILDIADNGLVIEAENLNPHPLDVPTPAERSIALNAETKFMRRVEKSAEEQAEAFSAFEKAFAKYDGSGALPTPPVSYTETDAVFADLKVGDRIAVESLENIWSAANFTASKISIIAQAPVEE